MRKLRLNAQTVNYLMQALSLFALLIGVAFTSSALIAAVLTF